MVLLLFIYFSYLLFLCCSYTCIGLSSESLFTIHIRQIIFAFCFVGVSDVEGVAGSGVEGGDESEVVKLDVDSDA